VKKAVFLATGLLACVTVAAVGGDAAPASERPCKRFCVEVSPKSGDTSTVFVFRGRGWRPNRTVEARFGAYCDVGQACPAVGYLRRVEVDAAGEFVFRFRNGPDSILDDKSLPANGGGPVEFTQRWRCRGKPRRSVVYRTPGYRVNGRLLDLPHPKSHTRC